MHFTVVYFLLTAVGIAVKNDGVRPTLQEPNAPKELLSLLEQCWHASPSQRPDAEATVKRWGEIMSVVTLPSLTGDSSSSSHEESVHSIESV